jgi:multidrug resistance efflux pump
LASYACSSASSYLTPSGKIEVTGRITEVTPNVSGQVVAIPVALNVFVKSGTTLFQIDRAPYEYKVRQLKAALAGARQSVEQLKANVGAAAADVKALQAQWERADKRRADLEQLGSRQATSEFRVEDAVAEAHALAAQLEAAKAREVSARLAATSEIDGENTTVAQLVAQLDNAQWELDQTTVRAPADGYVTGSTLVVGDRALPTKSAMSFIVASETNIIGVFPQNGFQTIRPGARAKLVFAAAPGRIHDAEVGQILRGVGEGQFAASGTLARVTSVGLTADYVVGITTPKDIDPASLRLGMSGTATVFSDHAGPIGILASILLWVKAYLMYL